MTRSSGKSKWIIIGGAGFIGSNLCRALMDRGDRVVCIDNLSTGDMSNVQDLVEKGMVFFKHDAVNATRPEWMDTALDGAAGVFYLASLASPKFYLRYPMDTIEVNTIGLNNWLNAAFTHDTQLIYTSTSEIYGDPDCEWQDEDYNGNVNPQGKRACYDESKRLGETLCSLYTRHHQVLTKIVRIFNTYGPYMLPDDGRVIPNFVNRALDGKPLILYGDGSQTRSFCFVRDIVEALMSTGDYPWKPPGEKGQLPTINLGNSQDHFTIRQVAEKVRAAINPELEILEDPSRLIAGDPKQRRPITKRAQRALAWMPTTDFESGLRETIDYFRRQRNVASDTE